MFKAEQFDVLLTPLYAVLGIPEKEISLHEPNFSGNEWQYVKDCIDTGWVSSVGAYVNQFEEKLAEFTGVKHAIAVVNGTAALHVCLILADVQPNDEVLLPALTFVATANAVAYCHATPHFIDADLNHLGIDVPKLADYLKTIAEVRDNNCYNKTTGKRIKAIIPVHIFGHSSDMVPLKALCQQYHLSLIEDATESLGSYYNGIHTGHSGETACLSFNGNKIITTGGGGAVLTNNPNLAKRAKHISTTAKQPHRFEFYHDEIGYNYRLPNINAALGCAQLEMLPTFLERKRALALSYQAAFEGNAVADVLKEPSGAHSNYWLNALILKTPNRAFVEAFMQEALSHKYGLRGLWTPMNQLPMFAACPTMDLTNTQRLFDSIISLPSGSKLGAPNAC